jgi:catechol 2,3-dioxygenase-like lactoylglutathione lyase family enzyme
MADLGLTHVAFSVRDVDASVAFYEKYAGMKVIDRRAQDAIRVVWLTDGTRPFIVVLIETADPADTPLGPLGHLGVACESRAEVDQRCAEAEAEGGCVEVGSIAVLRSDIPLFLSTLTGTRSSFPMARKSASPSLKPTLNSNTQTDPAGEGEPGPDEPSLGPCARRRRSG